MIYFNIFNVITIYWFAGICWIFYFFYRSIHI